MRTVIIVEFITVDNISIFVKHNGPPWHTHRVATPAPLRDILSINSPISHITSPQLIPIKSERFDRFRWNFSQMQIKACLFRLRKLFQQNEVNRSKFNSKRSIGLKIVDHSKWPGIGWVDGTRLRKPRNFRKCNFISKNRSEILPKMASSLCIRISVAQNSINY